MNRLLLLLADHLRLRRCQSEYTFDCCVERCVLRVHHNGNHRTEKKYIIWGDYWHEWDL